jgi:hypothetical protein
MSQINRVPLGLLSLLDTQSQGVVPDELSRTVTAGFDMAGLWYNSRGLERFIDAGTIQLVSGQSADTLITVPEGEIWAVVSASARITSTDATNFAQAVSLTFQPNSQIGVNTSSLAESPTKSLALNGIVSATANWSGGDPFFAPAGSRFGNYVMFAIPATAGSLPEVSVLFYRLRI